MLPERASVAHDIAYYLIGISPSESDSKAPNSLNHFDVYAGEIESSCYWYRPINRNEFEGPLGEQNLQSLEWLTPRILAHESVVKTLAERSAFYPASFGTLFSSRERIEELVIQNKAVLNHYFSHVTSRSEWGVKILCDWKQAITDYSRTFPAEAVEGLPAGRAYLRAKQLQKDCLIKTKDWVQEFLGSLRRHLIEQFADTRSRGVKNATVSESGPELIENLAVLVDKHDVSGLHAQLMSFIERSPLNRSLLFELSGPWPCYSFRPTLSSGS